jgi:hypothetical protein
VLLNGSLFQLASGAWANWTNVRGTSNFFFARVFLLTGGVMIAKGDCIMTPQEMRANARQCLSWSEAAHYRENREAFFALARAWMSAAIRLEQDNIPLETPLPVGPRFVTHRRRAA